VGPRSGAVYVYRRRGRRWILEARLEADDAAEGDGFGVSLALAGPFCLVGAPWKGDRAQHGGAAYVFAELDGLWLQRARLGPSEARESARFGRAVAIEGERLLVGAPGGGAETPDGGAAYLYRWVDGRATLLGALPRPHPEAGDAFGGAVALDGERLAVGARGVDTPGTGVDEGGVFAYSPPPVR